MTMTSGSQAPLARWQSIAIWVLLGVLVVYKLRSASDAIATSRTQEPNDGLTLYAERLSAFRQATREIPHLYYIQPTEPDQPMDRNEAWIYAQYTLAPTVLSQTTPSEFALADCFSPGQVARAQQESGYQAMEDFGQGVLLMRRPAR